MVAPWRGTRPSCREASERRERPPHERVGAEHFRPALQRLAAGGGAAHAREQPAPGRRREAGRARSSTAGSARPLATGRTTTRSSASSSSLADDETLLVQSGKPVAVFETHEAAPRVLLANSNLVPEWANWDEFRKLDAAGLMMYGQMTAGSWIYIGSQGILQGTYETFAAAARKRFEGLSGRPGGDCRSRRYGRRAAARRSRCRRSGAVRRGRPAADRTAHPDRLPRRRARLTWMTRCAASTPPARAARAVDRPRRQRRRGAPRARPARRAGRRGH